MNKEFDRKYHCCVRVPLTCKLGLDKLLTDDCCTYTNLGVRGHARLAIGST